MWSLGSAFLLLWLSVAALMYFHLDRQVSRTLDKRLAASATMVAGLIAGQPEMLVSSRTSPLLVSPEAEGVACQIRGASGEVLLQTSGVEGAVLNDARPGFSTREIGDQQWRLYTLEQSGTLITTADRMSERAVLANGIILVMVVPFALALVGGLVVLWWGIRSGLKPLEVLRDQLRRRTPENLDPVKVNRAPSELVPVVETLNKLFNRVASTLAWEQRFANSAAHEFRTPLTGIKTHLHVAGRVSGERQQQALANAEKGVAQLQSVTEQLLLLSRMNRKSEVASEGCLVAQAIEDALEDLPARERVRVENRCKEGRVAVPRALVVVVLRNLLDNALKYSIGTCDLLLDCSAFEVTAGGSQLRVTVRDRGVPDSSDSGCRSPESHGLGLAIVHMVVNQYGGALVSERNEAGGMSWQLTFPLSFND
ncbi:MULTISPECIES: sensor histidine kinase [unclassified Wenzhouxiangella]|uniref:sensor histidine kinase n=1 Tax=unclassified Wenzhouxiangella TaxID=2613841 RepID=UPI000E32731B|nr:MULTISPECIES: sensor histidine kinase [unclassified Wenzhouxiangella]RFF27718.1 sensor histidine kinase [Wenzhouxiangella sp. 15181]RFP69809.1 sensor histidine kinase [Wenzhouxiangella sp. 15190]